jgi:kinesin family protein 5
VIARFRPENRQEQRMTKGSVTVKLVSDEALIFKEESYTFDKVFGPDATQADVFNYSVTETADDLFQGYNGTVLAYGQTGSGKSYTMMGASIGDQEKKGLIPRITDVIFDKISKADIDTEYTLSASFMEIYLEQIKDLLDPRSSNLSIFDDPINGIYVKGLSKVYVTSAEEVYSVLLEGAEYRTTAFTDMNEESSRSHAIFQINLTQQNPKFGVKRSKLCLVDLAGSEKVQKTGVTGINLEEAKKINSSLSSLGNVINALTDPKATHVPYRHSKLTRILQDSLGGNSKTSLIINCSPSASNESETLSTLRFGTRAKKIKNRAHVNKEPSTLDLLTQIEQLRRLNEEQLLKQKEMAYELELWKSGIYKDPISQQSDFPLGPDMTIQASMVQEKTIEGQLSKSSTNLLDSGEELYRQKLSESQKLNDELMRDIQEQCTKNVMLQLELEESKDQRRPDSSLRVSEKTLALETTLDQFTVKMQELETQNNTLRKEISMIKKISETRNERIFTLESMVKSYKSQVEVKSTSSIESSMFSLRNPFSSYKKANNKHSTADGTSSRHNNVDSQFRCVSSESNGSLHENSKDYGIAGRSIPAYYEGKTDIEKRKRSNSGGGGITQTFSPAAITGLNLRIVKPMRGGSTTIMES